MENNKQIESLRSRLATSESKNRSLQETNTRLQRELNRLKNEFAPKMIITDSISDIVKSVANKFYKTNIEIKCRNSEVVAGRMLYYAWMRKYTELSLKSIARTLNTMADHSTVIHALRLHEDYLEIDKRYQKEWQQFCNEVEMLRNKIVDEQTLVLNAS